MEDQPTDTSDLTDTAASGADKPAASGADKPAASGADKPAASGADKPAASGGAVPVGKRGGRHRTFRPRPVAAAPSSGTAVGDAPEEKVAEAVEAESPGR